MEKLPPEVHVLILTVIKDEFELFHYDFNVAHQILQVFLSIMLTNHYFRTLATPILKTMLSEVFRRVPEAPWHLVPIPAKDPQARLRQIGRSKLEQVSQLLVYISSIYHLASSFRRWIVQETAPQREYDYWLSRSPALSPEWSEFGKIHYNSSWVRGFPKDISNIRYRTLIGLFCALKRFNEDAIMLRSSHNVIEVRTPRLVKEAAQAMRKMMRGNTIMGLDKREIWSLRHEPSRNRPPGKKQLREYTVLPLQDTRSSTAHRIVKPKSR